MALPDPPNGADPGYYEAQVRSLSEDPDEGVRAALIWLARCKDEEERRFERFSEELEQEDRDA